MDLKTDIKRILTLGSIDQTLRDIKVHSDVLDTGRYKYFDKVIAVYEGNAEKPKECLALAYAYMYRGAAYRTQAIRYFEKYLLKPVKVKGYRGIYLDLGKLYEAEYDFINAEKYYKLYIQANRSNTVGYVVLAKLYSKIDINKAVEFLSDILMSDIARNENFARIIHIEYEAYLKKEEEGYVYKPRKAEAIYNPNLEEVKEEMREDRKKDIKQNRRKVLKIAAVVLVLYAAARCSQGEENDVMVEIETTTEVVEPTSEGTSLSDWEEIGKNIDGIKKSADEIWNDPDVNESRENLKDAIKENVIDYNALQD